MCIVSKKRGLQKEFKKQNNIGCFLMIFVKTKNYWFWAKYRGL